MTGSCRTRYVKSRGLAYAVPASAQETLKRILKSLPVAARPIYQEHFRDIMAAKECAHVSAKAMENFIREHHPTLVTEHNLLARRLNREIDSDLHEGHEPIKFLLVPSEDEELSDLSDGEVDDLGEEVSKYLPELAPTASVISAPSPILVQRLVPSGIKAQDSLVYLPTSHTNSLNLPNSSLIPSHQSSQPQEALNSGQFASNFNAAQSPSESLPSRPEMAAIDGKFKTRTDSATSLPPQTLQINQQQVGYLDDLFPDEWQEGMDMIDVYDWNTPIDERSY